MMSSRSDVSLKTLGQADFDWLNSQNVSRSAVMEPSPVMTATGFAAADGLFEPVENAQRWLAFEEPEDTVFWQPRYGTIATYANRAFALGEAAIDNPCTYALDFCLTI
ncbi:MAG: hypothetical protein KDK08_26705, partial [Rhizobiaceae bacterium]|nr:hypothetical protein [Rhizobiaceae bacterium]